MPQRRASHIRGKPQSGKSKMAGMQAVAHQTIRGGSLAIPRSFGASPHLTRQYLLGLARQGGLKGRHRLKKQELIRALSTILLAFPLPKTGTPSSPSLLDWENVSLPEAYGKDRLVLMPVDPYWVHAYWEMVPPSVSERSSGAEKQSEHARYILRVYDVTSVDFDGTNAHSSFDIEITPQARNWYINLWRAGKSLCAELGLVHADGSFSSRVRSNVIQTPQASTSSGSEETWMRVEGKGGDPPSQQHLSSRGAVEPSPRVESSHLYPPSHDTHIRLAPVPSQSGLQEPSPHPNIRATEVPLHPKEAIRAEEYRRFLEITRRLRIQTTDEVGPPMLGPPSVEYRVEMEHRVQIPELGLSSLQLVKRRIESQPAPSEKPRRTVR